MRIGVLLPEAPMTTYFTADTHFGHQGIIGLCRRPYATAAEMDEDLISRWNAVVGPDDVVWHLGDFALGGGRARARQIFDRLNGSKRLVRGNHDPRAVLDLPWALPVLDLVELQFDGVAVVMCHYPMRAWRGSFRGAVHLYGHVHGIMPDTTLSCDVGVDAWGYRPVTLREIGARLRQASERPEEVRLVEAINAERKD